MGSRAIGIASTVLRRPDCDSPESEEAAKVAVDYINSHHHHGYKYTLNNIEEIKVIPRVPQGETFIMELELLETKCHIVNPLPVENCTVRSLAETKVEGDCDVALAKVQGTFTVTDSAEDVAKRCPDCPQLLPLNDTRALDLVSVSLSKFNTDSSEPVYFKLMEVGRLSTQTLPNGPSYFAEYAIVETNCTSDIPDNHHDDCIPLSKSLAVSKVNVVIAKHLKWSLFTTALISPMLLFIEKAQDTQTRGTITVTRNCNRGVRGLISSEK
ncbi:UNVERIFIED_CONTAM: hypothetical protein FKN15_071548 [Acipenser sinensis]